MNILLLSTGTRNKIVQYFKKEIGDTGKVICTDLNNIAPSIYLADDYYYVPKMPHPEYVNILLDICKKEKIDAVLSFIDPELSLIAEHRKEFNDLGTMLIESSYELCEMSLDKFEMYKWLSSNGFLCAKSYIKLEDFIKDYSNKLIDFPVFVKPVRGSASNSISKIDNMETLKNVMKINSSLMIQEFLDGQEIGADVYIDMLSKEVVSIFTKKKIKMRAGETDKAVSFKDEKLFKLIEDFVNKAGYEGQIDIDIFDIDGKYYISEVNPRFGGGYPHAYECGVNHIKYIINNIEGKINNKNIGNYEDGIYMLKYNEVLVRKINYEESKL